MAHRRASLPPLRDVRMGRGILFHLLPASLLIARSCSRGPLLVLGCEVLSWGPSGLFFAPLRARRRSDERGYTAKFRNIKTFRVICHM